MWSVKMQIWRIVEEQWKIVLDHFSWHSVTFSQDIQSSGNVQNDKWWMCKTVKMALTQHCKNIAFDCPQMKTIWVVCACSIQIKTDRDFWSQFNTWNIEFCQMQNNRSCSKQKSGFTKQNHAVKVVKFAIAQTRNSKWSAPKNSCWKSTFHPIKLENLNCILQKNAATQSGKLELLALLAKQNLSHSKWKISFNTQMGKFKIENDKYKWTL